MILRFFIKKPRKLKDFLLKNFINTQYMKFQKNLNVNRKNILVRVDLNVPHKDGKVSDSSKIILLKGTLQHLVNNNNKIFLLSHFGRPSGKNTHKYSLKFLKDKIEQILQLGEISFLSDCIGKIVENKISSMNYGEICLMENVRFHIGEEKNDLTFSKKLSKNFDIYVNEAFSASHRSHASIVGVTRFLPSYCGFLFEKEFFKLKNILRNPQRPVMGIIGGFKVSTKISVIRNLINNLDYLVIAGGMANTFLASKGYKLGSSTVEKEFFYEVKQIEKSSIKKGCKIILPTDVITAKKLDEGKYATRCLINNINKNQTVFDIGKDSFDTLKKLICEVRTILWNGPLGAFEYKPFDYSTVMAAKFMASRAKKYDLNVIIGGGDTLASLKDLNVLKNFSHVSTSGGAFLKFFEAGDLPGIKALSS